MTGMTLGFATVVLFGSVFDGRGAFDFVPDRCSAECDLRPISAATARERGNKLLADGLPPVEQEVPAAQSMKTFYLSQRASRSSMPIGACQFERFLLPDDAPFQGMGKGVKAVCPKAQTARNSKSTGLQ